MAKSQLEHLDEIAREAWNGNYGRVGVLSTGERLYVALASGRMREIAPDDSIAYAVDRVGPEWMEHMLAEWRSRSQPKTKVKVSQSGDHFEADPVDRPGSPSVGRGASITEALGDFTHHYQAEMGLEIEIDESAIAAEHQRRVEALKQRVGKS